MLTTGIMIATATVCAVVTAFILFRFSKKPSKGIVTLSSTVICIISIISLSIIGRHIKTPLILSTLHFAHAALMALLGLLIIRILNRSVDEYISKGGTLSIVQNILGIHGIFILKRVIKISITIIFVILIMDVLGINTSKLVISIGIGSAVFAFAAQKTIENMFGGLSIFVDRPFIIGDFCKFGTEVGNIEHIGWRSTRIRTLGDSLITVPNSMLSEMTIENYSSRESIRIYFTIGLQYDITIDQIKCILVESRKLFIMHPMLNNKRMYIRLANLGDHSIDIIFNSYILTTDWNKFLEVREDVILRVIEIINKYGASFAFPSQTIYLQRSTAPDKVKVDKVSALAREMEKNGDLPLKGFPKEYEKKIEDIIKY